MIIKTSGESRQGGSKTVCFERLIHIRYTAAREGNGGGSVFIMTVVQHINNIVHTLDSYENNNIFYKQPVTFPKKCTHARMHAHTHADAKACKPVRTPHLTTILGKIDKGRVSCPSRQGLDPDRTRSREQVKKLFIVWQPRQKKTIQKKARRRGPRRGKVEESGEELGRQYMCR